MVTVDELRVADAPEAWAALGFAVEGDVCALGEVRLRFVGANLGADGDGPPQESGAVAGGLFGWTLREVESTELDGLATARSEAPPPAPAPQHPNGVTGLDHVVAITPQLQRTVAALQAAGLDLRRIREDPTPAGAPRQAFFRLGPTILEVVQEPADVVAHNGSDRPAFFWGLALLAPEIDATVAGLGRELVSEVRDAVQPGRRIASLRRGAGLALPVALITPPPPREAGAG
ncbi:MAG TPA: hypothetical protein VMT37_12565 [Solirubrobacterales bacterium]|nr:hypothetical protein [Solirubrobacterales bacterium]